MTMQESSGSLSWSLSGRRSNEYTFTRHAHDRALPLFDDDDDDDEAYQRPQPSHPAHMTMKESTSSSSSSPPCRRCGRSHGIIHHVGEGQNKTIVPRAYMASCERGYGGRKRFKHPCCRCLELVCCCLLCEPVVDCLLVCCFCFEVEDA